MKTMKNSLVLIGMICGSGCQTLNIPDFTQMSVKEAVYAPLEPMVIPGEGRVIVEDAMILSPHTGKYVKLKDIPDPDEPLAGLKAWSIGWQDNPFEPVDPVR